MKGKITREELDQSLITDIDDKVNYLDIYSNKDIAISIGYSYDDKQAGLFVTYDGKNISRVGHLDFPSKKWDIGILYYNNYFYISYDYIDTEFNDYNTLDQKIFLGGNKIGCARTKDFINFEHWDILLPLEFKQTISPKFFIDDDGSKYMITTLSDCTEIVTDFIGRQQYKKYCYITKFNDDFKTPRWTNIINLTDTNGLNGSSKLDAFLTKKDSKYYLFIKEEDNDYIQQYSSSSPNSGFVLINEFKGYGRTEAPCVYKINNEYILFMYEHENKYNYIIKSLDLITWSEPFRCNMYLDKNIMNTSFYVCNTDNTKKYIYDYIKKRGIRPFIDDYTKTFNYKLFDQAQEITKSIDTLTLIPNTLYYIKGETKAIIQLLDTSKLNVGDKVYFQVQSESSAQLTILDQEKIYFNGNGNIILNKYQMNDLITLFCTNEKKECFISGVTSEVENDDTILINIREEVAKKAYIEYVDSRDADILRQVGQGVTDIREEVAKKAYIEYVDSRDADILRQVGQGVTDEQLKNAVQTKINDGSITSLTIGNDTVRPLNLNNGAKSIQPIVWRISESSVIKNDSSLTINSNIGCLYRDKYIYVTPATYTFSESDSYLVLRDTVLQNTATSTHTPIIVKRNNINENDIIISYYSTYISTIWDGIIAEYRSQINKNILSVPFTTERRTPLGSYGYISSRYPFNIDTVNKKIIFNTETYICYNSNFIKIKNTVIDITNALNGGHLYFDITKQDCTTTKPLHENFIVLGTIWINPLVVGLNTTNGFTVNGMFYNHTISRWNGEVLNVIGDSITYGVGCTIQYHQWLKQLCGFKTVNNYGVSGSTIARRPNNNISWDTATALVDRINLIDKNAKVTMIFMGVNDFITGRLLGTFDSTDVTTFYGALHYICKYFRENMPDKIVTFITPMQFNWKLRPPVGNNTDGTNKNGNTLLDFVNTIKEVCGFYGYTVKDMYHNCFYGLSDKTVETFMPDKLHVNDLGHKEIIAPRIASHLNSH